MATKKTPTTKKAEEKTATTKTTKAAETTTKTSVTASPPAKEKASTAVAPKAEKEVKTNGGTTSKTAKITAFVTAEQVATRAYHIWLERGCTHGSDVQDWLRAEAELKN